MKKKTNGINSARTVKARYEPFVGKPVAFDRDEKVYKFTEHSIADYEFIGIDTAQVNSKSKTFAVLKSGEHSLLVINYKQLVVTSNTS